MRIWIFNPFEPLPEDGFGELRYGALARELCARGHQVIWWSSDFLHFKKSYRRRSRGREPFEIRQVHATSYTGHSSPRRLWSHALLALSTLREVLREEQLPQLIVASLPPVELPALVTEYAIRRGIPVCVDITDTWPDAFSFLLPRWLEPLTPLLLAPHGRAAARALRGCAALTAVSRTFLDWGVARGREGIPRAVFPWVVPTPRPPVERRELISPLEATFCGSFGLTYDFELMLEAAALLHQEHPGRVVFNLIGTGPRLARVRRRARTPNVRVPGPMDQQALDRALRGSHLGLCCYEEGAPQSLPIKLFWYLGYGLPVINTLGGEMGDLLAAHRMGITVRGPRGLADALLELSENPASWHELSASALTFSQEHGRKKEIRKMADFITDLVGSREPRI